MDKKGLLESSIEIPPMQPGPLPPSVDANRNAPAPEIVYREAPSSEQQTQPEQVPGTSPYFGKFASSIVVQKSTQTPNGGNSR